MRQRSFDGADLSIDGVLDVVRMVFHMCGLHFLGVGLSRLMSKAGYHRLTLKWEFEVPDNVRS